MPNNLISAGVAGHKKGRVPRALREQQLLDIAEELFLAHGYEATSIEDICRLADVSRPVVYDLFGNKAAIYLACVRRARAGLEEAIAAAAATSTDVREQFDRGADAYFKVLEHDPRRWELLFGKTGSLGELGDALATERFRTVETIAAVLRAAAPGADPDTLDAYANLISGAGEQLGRWWLRNRHISRQTVVQRHADFAWNGFGALVGETHS
jgi:AcrR family transcriptional regulator